MGLLNINRRRHLREKLSAREIARRTGLSRNTVSKHLAANTTELKYATPERPSKLDPFAEKLAGWLESEATKPRKQKRILKQLHADLVALGFTGSYGRVAAFARGWWAAPPWARPKPINRFRREGSDHPTRRRRHRSRREAAHVRSHLPATPK